MIKGGGMQGVGGKEVGVRGNKNKRGVIFGSRYGIQLTVRNVWGISCEHHFATFIIASPII